MSAWELSALSVHFRGITAVDGASLTVAPGERVGLVGASGSGKTTLMRAGLGLVPRAGGRVRLFGEDVSGWSAARWQLARHRAQLLFQDPRAMLHPALGIGLLLMDSAVVHKPDSDPEKVARAALERVGLEGRFDARPHELSGGERRRAGVARVVITQPLLLVADEPTVGLDAGLKADLLELLLGSLQPECAVVLVSHDLPVVAWASDRIVVMEGGKVVEDLDTGAISAAQHPSTRRLLEAGGLVPARSHP